jgi:CelD/BcsL family acetyltransferase involved in cellulose biosynthesis
VNYYSHAFAHEQSRSGTATWQVILVRRVAELDGWADAWRRLDRRSTASFVFFQSHDWCRQWWRQQSLPGHEPAVFLVFEEGRLIAVLPMMQTRSAGVKILRPLGEPHTQYSNLLTEEGLLPDGAASALRQAISASGADLVLLHYVPEGSPLRMVLPPSSRAAELGNVSLQYDLSAHGCADSYDKSADKKLRQLRRRADTYLSKHGPLSLKVLKPADPGYAEAVRDCIAMKMVWISETARNLDGLGQRDHAAFLASLPGGELLDGGIVFALMSGDVAIAYQTGFLQRGQYYLYTAGFDWSLRAFSPGMVLIDMTMRWLIDKGVATFDMMGNPSGYKERLANRQTQLDGHVLPLTLKGAAYGKLWSRKLRPVLRAVYHRLPVGLRHGLNRLRKPLTN